MQIILYIPTYVISIGWLSFDYEFYWICWSPCNFCFTYFKKEWPYLSKWTTQQPLHCVTSSKKRFLHYFFSPFHIFENQFCWNLSVYLCKRTKTTSWQTYVELNLKKTITMRKWVVSCNLTISPDFWDFDCCKTT